MPSSSTLKSLLITCVLAAFAFSTAWSYNCESCSSNPCSPDQTCEATQGCFNNKQQLQSLGDVLNSKQSKGCNQKECTSLAFTASLGNGYTFWYDHRCCHSEKCNKDDISGPQKSSDPNGVKCYACYTDQNISCDPVPLTCTGTETKCAVIIGTVGPYFAAFAMGCTTESACQLNATVLDNIDIRTYCIDPISGNPPLMPIISSMLTGLFLLNVLL
ncbi:protein RoBo-1-like [Elephas maximus indicus]|uniref:protein RoBo-1-like n=1 Tax=Elephas maximus indicus TaxID=99487 RepID=UPI002116C1A6|nr:protein RoBo-1-like [Elephas maximus indicus]